MRSGTAKRPASPTEDPGSGITRPLDRKKPRTIGPDVRQGQDRETPNDFLNAERKLKMMEKTIQELKKEKKKKATEAEVAKGERDGLAKAYDKLAHSIDDLVKKSNKYEIMAGTIQARGILVMSKL